MSHVLHKKTGMKHRENLCSEDDESVRKSVEKSLEGDDGVSAGAEEKDGKRERRIRAETRPLQRRWTH